MEPSAQEHAFAAEVDRYRVAARVTQQWLALRVGLSRPKISEICSGRYLPSREALDALITALAMESERAVGLWQAACQARWDRSQADKLARHPAPEDWTALPVLPAEIRSLLHAQVEAATDMPYRLPGARNMSLATVYVRQDLGSAVEQPQQDQPRPQPVLDERGVLFLPTAPTPRLTVRPPSRAVRNALDDHDHLVVTGGPGQGKSSLSLRLTAEIATRWLQPKENGTIPLAEPVVPLRLTARELAIRLDMPFPQALAESIRAEYGSLLRSEITAGLLDHRVAGCRWLLLVDGLDEVADGVQQERLVRALAMRAVDSPCRVVLTTRPIEGAVLAPMQRAAAVRYELQPFNEEAFRNFAMHWFTPEGAHAAERFLHQVRQAHLDELVRVPLLATIAAIIFQQYQDRPLPDNRYELYEAYLLFLRSARTLPAGPFEGLRGALLEHLGQVRLEADTSLVNAALAWVAEHTNADDLPLGWQDGLTTFLASVGPMIRRAGDLQFLHHSFAEHLAATGKARQLPEKFDPLDAAFRQLLHAARQKDRGRLARDVLLHYTRLHPSQANNLVCWLHAGSAEGQLIAARLLAQHVPASPDVVDAFLGTARMWATTKKYTANEILNRVCRVVYHPGLAQWLIDLMRDHTMPWRSRVEAAMALATRLRGPHAEEATALLRTVVEDTDVPTTDRLTAADGLAECGAPERAVAERGLRSLLDDPTVPAARRRGAAVVLAGLGPEGRTYAAQALVARLDDPAAPMTDLFESAAGLVEIGAEFHERSAQAFRQVLHSPAHMFDRREAAVGLAGLGPDHLSEAVDALTTLVPNRRLDYFERARAAETLAKMGPQYRLMAASYLRDMLIEPGIDSSDRRHCAETLAGLGTEFHPTASAHLRKVIKNSKTNTNATLWAVKTLADLGPDFHAEAATEFLRLADDPLTVGFEHAAALGGLAELGSPHRPGAIQRLRAVLNDRNAEPDTRSRVAGELVDLGTEFHAEVGEALSEIVRTCADPVTVVNACGMLISLSGRFHQLATDALLVLLYSPSVDINTLTYSVNILTEPSTAPDSTSRQHTTDALENVLTDPTRGDWSRLLAARHFVRLDGPYHRIGVDTHLRLLRQAGGPHFPIHLAVGMGGVESVGSTARTEIAEALCELLAAPDIGPERTWQVAQALAKLEFDDLPDVVPALCAVAGDATADMSTRCAAAVNLAELAAEHLPFALAVVQDIATTTVEPVFWREAMLSLNRLGEDAVPLIQAVLANHDASRRIREAAAVLLPELRADLTSEAIGELREQAADRCLNFRQRTEVITSMAVLDETARDDAIAFHAAVVNDEHAPADERCYAAKQLVHLDRAHWASAVATVRRLLADPRTKPADQRYAADQLRELRALRSEEADRLALAIAHHPEASPEDRADATRHLRPGPTRLALQGDLLADHSAPLSARIPETRFMDDRPLVVETEAALCDVLTAVDFGRGERVEAATQLAKLAPTLVADAVRVLRELSVGADGTTFEARKALARLDGPWWHEVVDDATHMIADESLSPRQRWRAATVVLANQPKPSTLVLDFLRNTASNERVSERHRIDALFALHRTDGLGPLRAIRDDDHITPASRAYAADLLSEYAVEDRAAAARLLSDIAVDPTVRPALRWRTAEDLAKFGVPGRERAADALSDITTDENLPATARAQAARVLAEIRPSRFKQALTSLRQLMSIDDPLRRTQVLLALGSLDTAEAVPALRAMADDRALGPVVRLRCAEALVELRRDQREVASVVTRELMRDESVPPHVRSRAARDLARWSELCREEARKMLQALNSTVESSPCATGTHMIR